VERSANDHTSKSRVRVSDDRRPEKAKTRRQYRKPHSMHTNEERHGGWGCRVENEEKLCGEQNAKPKGMAESATNRLLALAEGPPLLTEFAACILPRFAWFCFRVLKC
jgi:hypothetical protein